MNSLQKITRVAPVAIRALSTTGSRAAVDMRQPFASTENKGEVPSVDGYQKVRHHQSDWTKEDGSLVWQKRGVRDSLPYQMSLFLCLGGTLLAFQTLWVMSWPRAKKED